ncbi:TIR domain-containing protein [Variovorax sp. J22P271]|uniref:TIR domain-containing protein n=1 Tax=Variovorax davisae TaxID=3053515 RepID=UPI00257545FB|nr:TIR domain-containing protein [Variovorax sp. J22P271]MDM0035290.1 TIR domain-containing protein [Variovorax sp. J22P271]
MVNIRPSDAFRLLQLALQQPEPTLGRIIARLLADAGIAVHDSIHAAIEAAEPKVWVVNQFAEASAEAGDVETLEALLRQRTGEVRRHAARLLARHGNLAHVAALREAWEAESLASVGSEMQAALAVLERQGAVQRQAAVALDRDDELCLRLLLERPVGREDAAGWARLFLCDSRFVATLAVGAAKKDPSATAVQALLEALPKACAPVQVGLASILLEKDRGLALQALHASWDGTVAPDSEMLQALITTRDARAADIIARSIAGARDKDEPRRALASMGHEGYMALLRAFRSDERIRRSEADLLGRLGGELAIEPLIEALRDDAQGTRGAAAEALSAQLEAARQPLHRALEASQFGSSVVDLLIEADDPDLPGRLLAMCSTGDMEQRAFAMRMLCKVHEAQAHEVVRGAAIDANWQLRAAAAIALADIAHAFDDVWDILASLSADIHEAVWRPAIDAIESMAATDRGAATRLLLGLLIDRPPTRDLVMRKLRSVGDSAAIGEARNDPRFGDAAVAAGLSEILEERAPRPLSLRHGESSGAYSIRPADGSLSDFGKPGPIRGRRQAISGAVTHATCFTVTTARSGAPGTNLLLDVWAHADALRDKVLRRARGPLGGARLYSKSVGPASVESGAILEVDLVVPSLRYREAAHMLWLGEISNCSFMVAIPDEAAPGACTAWADIKIERMRIARLHFEVMVGAPSLSVCHPGLREHRAKTAFASYASEDRHQVLGRVQGMQKIVPELDIFLDVVALRSGDDWAKRIDSEISRRDVFYLFWSGYAQQSPHVDHEWRTALKLKGIKGIDPVPLVPPRQVPPPAELAQLHFGDWTVAMQTADPR